jgi:tRNA(Ile)-lysidine synthase
MTLAVYSTSAFNALAPFESKPELAVAVSGGADSMALVLLADSWVRMRGGRVIALTVDHGLRAESKDEAEQVGQWLLALGIKHHALKWYSNEKPASGIPEAARAARYALLTQWCLSHGVLHLLVAHHAHDQAETFALRMRRGIKGVGLSGMSAITVRNGVRILRPLLDVNPADLRTYLQDKHQDWIEDPSNQNLAFARNDLRHNLDENENAVLFKQAQSNAIARVLSETSLAKAMARNVSVYPEGWATYKAANALQKEQDVQIFMACIQAIGASRESLRWDEVKYALDILHSRAQPAITLGGCYIYWSPDYTHLVFIREQAAIQKAQKLQKGGMLWDGRFFIDSRSFSANTVIEALGEKDFLAIKQHIPKDVLRRIPRKVFLTLPAVKALEEVVKVPHINFTSPSYADVDIIMRWEPTFSLTAHPFECSGARGQWTDTLGDKRGRLE